MANNVVEHNKHIFEKGELDEKSTCRKFRQVQTEGGRSVIVNTNILEQAGSFGAGSLYKLKTPE